MGECVDHLLGHHGLQATDANVSVLSSAVPCNAEVSLRGKSPVSVLVPVAFDIPCMIVRPDAVGAC